MPTNPKNMNQDGWVAPLDAFDIPSEVRSTTQSRIEHVQCMSKSPCVAKTLKALRHQKKIAFHTDFTVLCVLCQDSNAAFDDVAYDAGSPRRLQGAAGGGQPTLGTGSSGARMPAPHVCRSHGWTPDLCSSLLPNWVEWTPTRKTSCDPLRCRDFPDRQ